MKIKLLLILISMSFLLNAQTEIYDKWDELTGKYIKRNFRENIIYNSVDYSQLKGEAAFPEIIVQLKNFDTSILLSAHQKMAFWVNVYNIAAIKVVLENDIPASIKNAGTIFKPVWKNDAINVGGTNYSLGEIEHEILRKMNEPLIHFGIVCASLSCPDLKTEAYRPETVIPQLEENTRMFLQNETKGMNLNKAENVVELSAIFKWFKADFQSGIPQFVKQYSKIDISDYKIRYMDYNWKLNTK